MATKTLLNTQVAETQEWLEALSIRHQELVIAQQNSATGARAQLAQAISTMETLLGAEEGPPDTTSIRGVLRFSDGDMAQNAGLALRLAFLGLEQLSKATIDAAKVLAT